MLEWIAQILQCVQVLINLWYVVCQKQHEFLQHFKISVQSQKYPTENPKKGTAKGTGGGEGQVSNKAIKYAMRFHFFQTILKSAETMLMEFINCFNIGIWKIVPKYSWKMPPPPITVYRNNFVPNEPNELGGDISKWMEDSGIPELWANFEPSVRVEHPNEIKAVRVVLRHAWHDYLQLSGYGRDICSITDLWQEGAGCLPWVA